MVKKLMQADLPGNMSKYLKGGNIMQVIDLNDRRIYRAKKKHKVKFIHDNRIYVEIVVPLDDKREVEEVKE